MPDAPLENRRPIGEVIAIGDELTTGQRLDTNTQWLSQRLTERGVDIRYHTTVADDLEANIAVFRAAAERADLVVSTGGLGPTADDLTRDAMAAAAGVPLVEHANLLAALEERFASRGRTMPPQNARQAQLPEGAAAIPNPGGTAPGVDQRVGRCRLFALPGVPAEMREMWAETVAPALDAMPGERRVVRHWLVKCFGAGESHLESLLGDLIARGREPLVGITASKGTITLRVTASGADEAACYEAMRPTLEEVRRKLCELIFAEQPGGEDEIELERIVVDQLQNRGVELRIAEGMTQGLLGHSLAGADPDYRVLRGGEIFRDESADIAEQASRLALGGGYALVIGHTTPQREVPIAFTDGGRVVTKRVTLIGHPSIHRPLTMKHALNLVRLELLGSRGEAKTRS